MAAEKVDVVVEIAEAFVVVAVALSAAAADSIQRYFPVHLT